MYVLDTLHTYDDRWSMHPLALTLTLTLSLAFPRLALMPAVEAGEDEATLCTYCTVLSTMYTYIRTDGPWYTYRSVSGRPRSCLLRAVRLPRPAT